MKLFFKLNFSSRYPEKLKSNPEALVSCTAVHLECAGPHVLPTAVPPSAHVTTAVWRRLLWNFQHNQTQMFRITVIGKLWTRSHFDTEFHFAAGSAVAHSVCPCGVLEGCFFSHFLPFCLSEIPAAALWLPASLNSGCFLPLTWP